VKLISAHYPLPEELQHAYSPEEASALVRDSLGQGRDIPGLQALRAEHTTVFDTDIVSQVKNGKWLLVKDEAYYFDWGQFDEPVKEKLAEHKVMTLLQPRPAAKQAERRIFRAVDCVTKEPLPRGDYIARGNGESVRGATDAMGEALINFTLMRNLKWVMQGAGQQ